jgi:hypothetical protein
MFYERDSSTKLGGYQAEHSTRLRFLIPRFTVYDLLHLSTMGKKNVPFLSRCFTLLLFPKFFWLPFIDEESDVI